MISALLISGGVNATNYWPVTDAGYGNGSYDTTTSVELLLMDPQNGQVIQNCSLPNMPENRYEHQILPFTKVLLAVDIALETDL